LCIDAVFQNFLLEESGTGGNCYCKVALDMVLTGKDLSTVRFEVYQALFTGAFTAANGVQDYAGLARSLEKCSTCVNGDLLIVGLESDCEVFHSRIRLSEADVSISYLVTTFARYF
jgi:hypothetical protein